MAVMPKRSLPAGSSLGGSHASFLESFPVLERKVAVESLQVSPLLLRCLFV